MRKQKFDLTNDQKNIAKRFLLCNCPTCTKDDGQTAVATKLCPFCYKVGYCCNQCMTKDLSRHVENECQKNLNSSSSLPSTQNQTTNNKTPTFIDVTKSQRKLSSRNSILKDTVNDKVNNFLSNSDDSTEESESDIDSNSPKRNKKTQPKTQKKQLSRSNSKSRK